MPVLPIDARWPTAGECSPVLSSSGGLRHLKVPRYIQPLSTARTMAIISALIGRPIKLLASLLLAPGSSPLRMSHVHHEPRRVLKRQHPKVRLCAHPEHPREHSLKVGLSGADASG